MKICEVLNRDDLTLACLLDVWESSVRATHFFLPDSEIKKIKESVASALSKVKHLIVCENQADQPMAFLGIEKGRLEMLFVSPPDRGRGVGKKLLQYGIKKYDISEVAVNEQNSQAVGFYEHMGFKSHRKTDFDEEGRPYPLLYMKLI